MSSSPRVLSLLLLIWPGALEATPGEVVSEQKISHTQGGFGGVLDDGDTFGSATAALGDLDGDGVGDLAVGARGEDDGAPIIGEAGAVWILFLDPNGRVERETKIGAAQGGFVGPIGESHLFGSALASLGDLNGDGFPELAVSAPGDDEGGFEFESIGAVWILSLDPNGMVTDEAKISATQGGFSGTLGEGFGQALAALGDLDGDGVRDLAVGQPFSDDGGSDRGAVWILFLNSDGSVKNERKISDTQGGFGGVLADGDRFGQTVTALGDLDGDGVADLAVGAPLADAATGALWILFLDPNAAVMREAKISATQGGFTGPIEFGDFFGASASSLGDIDGDGSAELAVGAVGDDDGAQFAGAVWVLSFDPNGAVQTERKISATQGSFVGPLALADQLGCAVAGLGDHDGDGRGDLVAGAVGDDDGGTDRGAAWIMNLDGVAALCGDLDVSELVDATDVSRYRGFLANPIGAPLTPAEQSRCSVIGTPAQCSIVDVAVMLRDLASRAPGISKVCSGVPPIP